MSICPPARKPTTACSIVAAAVAAILPAAALAEPRSHSEEDLVRAYLSSAHVRARVSAQKKQRQALALVAPYLNHPELSLRREQSLGGASEFSTTVAGLALTLEIGGRHGLRQEAARLDARALALLQQSGRHRRVCDLRRLMAGAMASQRVVAILRAGQTRLEAVAGDVKRLVKAGERAPYETDRLRLQVEEHASRLAARRARLSARLAELSSFTGLQVRRVQARAGSRAGRAGSGVMLPAARAMEIQARAAAVRHQVTGRSWVPDLGLYAAYRLDQVQGGAAGHGYEAGLTLNLPLSDAGRVQRGRSDARGAILRARISLLRARRQARLAALQARAAQLRRAARRPALDLTKLGQAAARRYLTGVGPLSALLDALGALERVALQRTQRQAELRAITLEMECARGAFQDSAIQKMVTEVTP